MISDEGVPFVVRLLFLRKEGFSGVILREVLILDVDGLAVDVVGTPNAFTFELPVVPATAKKAKRRNEPLRLFCRRVWVGIIVIIAGIYCKTN